MTFNELCEACYEHNEKHHITQQYGDKENRLTCYVVFKQMPYWEKQYTELERTYEFSSDNKRFIAGMGGNSIFASCLGYEDNIRVDWYLGDWEIEKCWYVDSKGVKHE